MSAATSVDADGTPGTVSMLVRRTLLIVYWGYFAYHAHERSRAISYLESRRHACLPFPWDSVVTVWVVLAMLTAILYALLQPPTFGWSWHRLRNAIGFALGMVGFEFLMFRMHRPHAYYTIGFFAITTLLGLIGVTAVLGGLRLVRAPAATVQPSGND